jgi:A/G-specific adenine glycosylase
VKRAPTLPTVRRRLLKWFANNRRDLPWRRTHNPYLIAVSEVMLQQTQVDRVKPKFLAWRRAWPTTKQLASADLYDVLQLWSGLGYNSRGKRLRDAARAVMERYGGRWPTTVPELETLPGFGPYTARAVASFSVNANVAVIDTNVRRVLSRIFFGLKEPRTLDLQDVVDRILPRGRSAEWNAALMDFGSAVCISRTPKCAACPLQSVCRAYPTILQEPTTRRAGHSVRFQETDRYWRGEILRQVLRYKQRTVQQLLRSLQAIGIVDNSRVVRLIEDLCREGLLHRRGQKIRLAS